MNKIGIAIGGGKAYGVSLYVVAAIIAGVFFLGKNSNKINNY